MTTTEQRNIQLAALVAGMPDLVAALDLELRYIAFSRSYKKEFEKVYGPTIAVGTTLTEALAHLPEERESAMHVWERALRGEEFTIEREFGDPRRERVFYRITFSSLRDGQGNLIGASMTGRDMTDLRRSEEARRASESRYQTFFEKMSEGFALGEPIFDAEGVPVDFRFLEANPAFERQTGLTREALNRPFSEVLPHLEPSWVDVYCGVALTGKETRFENYNRDTDRHYDVFCFSPEPGKFAILFRDVTEQREKEERLRRNSETFHHLIQNNPFGVYIVDADFRLILVSAGALHAFRNIHPLIGRDFSEIMEMLWPEEFVAHAVGRFRHTLQTGEPYAQRGMVEQRMDVDEIEAYDWRIERIVLPDGGFGVVCYFYDLSERQRWEEALRESEERFRNIADHSPVMIWLTEADGRCIWLNKPWYDFTGQAPEEGLGLGWLDAVHPEDAQRSAEIFRNANARGEPFSFEYRLRRKDGIYRWCIDSAAPRFGAEGEFLGYVGSVIDITERKEAEDALLKSEAQWNAAIENFAEGAILATEDEQVIYWNPAAREMHGFNRPDEFIEPLEKTPITFQLWTPDGGRLLELDEWPMRRIKRGETVRDLELGIRRPDQGWEKIFSYSGTMVETAGGERLIFLTCRDLTELRQAEQALRESEEKYRAIFERAAVGMGRVLFDDARWVEVNDAFCNMLGYSPEEMRATPWPQITHPEDIELDLVPFRRMTAGELESYSVEKRFIHKEGHLVWARLTLSLVRDPHGAPDYEIAIIENITARKEAEEALRRLTEELERRVEERTAELSAANRELEAFSYSVSHDLRAPLRHIAGFVEMLEAASGEALDETGRRYVRIISDSARHMGQLIDDLLTFSRIGRTAMKIVPVGLDRLVEQSLRELAPEIKGRPIEWRIEPLPQVQGDPVLLRTVMTNLLSNALKYTRHRNPAVIEIGCRHEGGDVVCRVKDNGAGFDMRYADKLFGVFQRLHRAEEFEGTGIGLASVKRIVERHGGRVWAEGALDRGAAFHFTLPSAGTESGKGGDFANGSSFGE